MSRVDKRSRGIRQAPKHLEKMLFVNHKEEQGLQRRLETITTDSRVRGRLLDRERIKVRNECRFNSRLNYQNIAPLLDKIPSLIQKEMTKHGYTLDSVNDHLIRESRRNSMVIPSILSTVNKEMNKDLSSISEDEETDIRLRSNKSVSGSDNNRLASKTKSVPTKGAYFSPHIISPRPAFYHNTTVDEIDGVDSDEEINPQRITKLVKDIAKIRNDMFANKKIDLMRSRISFPELVRNAREKENKGSESDTYTDGTCVLLRRKMQKLKKHAAPDPNLQVYSLLGQGPLPLTSGKGCHSNASPRVPKKRHSVAQSSFSSQTPALPSINVTKSANTMGAIARQSILENDEKELKRQLDEQERQQTELKVAIETRRYQYLQRKVNDFLEKKPKRPAIPLIYETDLG